REGCRNCVRNADDIVTKYFRDVKGLYRFVDSLDPEELRKNNCVLINERSTVTFNTVTQDMIDVYKHIQTSPEIDAKKIVVLANSEGGLHAAKAINDGNLRPAALLMLSTGFSSIKRFWDVSRKVLWVDYMTKMIQREPNFKYGTALKTRLRNSQNNFFDIKTEEFISKDTFALMDRTELPFQTRVEAIQNDLEHWRINYIGKSCRSTTNVVYSSDGLLVGGDTYLGERNCFDRSTLSLLSKYRAPVYYYALTEDDRFVFYDDIGELSKTEFHQGQKFRIHLIKGIPHELFTELGMHQTLIEKILVDLKEAFSDKTGDLLKISEPIILIDGEARASVEVRYKRLVTIDCSKVGLNGHCALTVN
ncbi:MAG: hypothetical protein HYZ65_13375, partial [Burkholderiales bacterium]|nr:hypothetical protein [Burkholderiales bacterium]